MIKETKVLMIEILPQSIRKRLKKLLFGIKFRHVQQKHTKALELIREKKNINVVFYAIFDSVWKYEGVYESFKKDSRYSVHVAVIPHIVEGKIQMDTYHRTLGYFKDNGYNIVPAYNGANKSWINIKETLEPDIIFFALPYSYTLKEYTIENHLDNITCFVPYTFDMSHLYEGLYNSNFVNLVTYHYMPTEFHRSISEQYSANSGKNCVVTGYPGTDVFFSEKYLPIDNWKITDKNIKRIIWAPHHTIDDNKTHLSFSSFLSLHKTILEFLQAYTNEIQIAFKPHPILKQKLYKHSDWGQKKTDAYYDQWKNLENGQLEQGSYIDLFKTSDAIIHDSGSFLIEYLHTGKPALYTCRDTYVTDRMNDFGKRAFSKYYHAYSDTDIKKFIQDVVLEGKDYMKEERIRFKNQYLAPPNNISASKNIFNHLNELVA